MEADLLRILFWKGKLDFVVSNLFMFAFISFFLFILFLFILFMIVDLYIFPSYFHVRCLLFTCRVWGESANYQTSFTYFFHNF